MSPMKYTIALSNSLRAHNLTHPVYDVLACVATFQAENDGTGHATYPRISAALGCTFTNVQIHVSRNPEFFQVETGHALRRLRLTAEAIELLSKIKGRIEKTVPVEASAIAAP